jgi:CBS domain-containing protein
MTVYDCCRKDVVTASPDAKVMEIIHIMDDKNVGSVVIIEQKKPVGILTDRDIVLRVVNRNKDPNMTNVRDVMTKNPTVLRGEMGLFDALRQMKGKHFRRIPVVNGGGQLSGIITVDDLMRLLIRELSCVATVLEEQTPDI